MPFSLVSIPFGRAHVGIRLFVPSSLYLLRSTRLSMDVGAVAVVLIVALSSHESDGILRRRPCPFGR